ncbi:MAG TPA: PKD domain-containing protein [Thermoanaerobaculia bacterium]|nr:PKD domain-containing protein [Thermoanaerobaculia bacterium]
MAHRLVEGCLDAVRTTLKSKQLLGASSSRGFILQYLGSHLLRNVLRGETSFLTTYEKLKEEWAERGERGISAGTENINPTATCSLWATALRSGKKKYFTASDGAFKIQLRLRRPDDDEKRKPGIAGNVGFEVWIFAGKDLVTVTPTDEDVPVSDGWALPPPSDRALNRREQIARIAERFRDSLGEQPQTFIDVLDAHPQRLGYIEGSKYWSGFLQRAAKPVAALTTIVLVLMVALIVSAPQEARAQMANGLQELKDGLKAAYLRWCPGCGEPNRKSSWDFEKPELYYSPPIVSLRAKKQSFTLEAKPGAALPILQSEEAHVEAVSDLSNPLRVRIAVTPSKELRRDDTKYYINFGDDPKLKGSTNKMIAVGPAALMEHVFPRPGLYTVRVIVAAQMPNARRDPFPALPPRENDLYSTEEIVEIAVRVGE